MSERCGVPMRGGKMCGRPAGHNGGHKSTQAVTKVVEYNATRYTQNRTRHAEQTRKSKLAVYGLTPEDYDALLFDQAGRCAICRRKPTHSRRLAVDHDHMTGEARGLLCLWCNREIGYLHENVAWLNGAAAYLTSPPSREVFDSPRYHKSAPPRRPSKGE